ncbi:alkaline phosphatase family protein [Lichenifustis flavocetrariae]|uniref:Phosphoesterase n=1 Tax=Lichenifustis flavocetrariae TaxID=2949735 RepID=A0AA41YWY7_9HYPH|nr:alkaline phosphatase family protein [Lichenifustis flavocetrariae]MCW6508820.1 hypothetical protein [Lichenifustis flavocetrariae]
MLKTFLTRCSALVTVASLLQPAFLTLAFAETAASVTAQPTASDPLVTQNFIDPASNPQLTNAQMAQLLRQKIKYVFVIFNENESFDHEYGTFPGVNGIYSTGQAPRSAAATPGFNQTYFDAFNNTANTVHPFLLGPSQNSTYMDSVDHSHTGLAKKLDVVNGTPKMDGFAQDEFTGKAGSAPASQAAEAKGRQFANLVMSHIDCDTIPFFWRYASRFTIFDNIFATEDTPSTPNAIAMIAGQSGETQWVKHGPAGTTGPVSGTINGISYSGTATTAGLPIVNDPNPYWGSEFDTTTVNRQPTSPKENYTPSNVAPNLTFATVPLTAMGTGIKSTLSGDQNAASNEADIQKDIPAIAASGAKPVEWRWYQSGYDHEVNDPTSVATHQNYVAHHQGPQYFGYLANNNNTIPNLRGETDFFDDIAGNKLPANGGIIYIRGGYNNQKGFVPPIQNPNYPAALTSTDITTIDVSKNGDDDHPGYSDRQITEANDARIINAIAANPTLWSQSAIIMTYDESDGFYDHVPPRILSYGPDSLPLSRGVRVPLLVISPYARAHTVSHAEGDHNAVIETINAIFNLPALSSLPDEADALAAGNSAAFNQFGPAGFQQKYLGPRDTNSPITDSLLSAFDPKRLRGLAPILPGSYAMIPDNVVNTLPHYNGNGCSAIGITTEDRRQGITANPPTNFNTMASTLPQYNIPSP